jgi:sec-independent protein translocase protein TatC
MSGAVSEDTARRVGDARATVGATLSRAQTHLRKAFVVFLVGLLGTIWAMQTFVWDELKRLTTSEMPVDLESHVEIIATTPFDVILLQAKIGVIVGVVLTVPVLLFYGRGALRRRGWLPSSPVAKWRLGVLLLAILGLFVGGVAYGYFVFFPIMFRFLAGNAVAAGIEPTYSIVEWTEFIVLLSASFGLAAQLPLAMSTLSYAEIVPYETFRDKWRHAVVVIAVGGALFSPPDPFTLAMWAAPLIALYGVSLYLAKVLTLFKRHGGSVSPWAVLRLHRRPIGILTAIGVALGAGGWYGLETLASQYDLASDVSAAVPAPLPTTIANAVLGGLVLGVIFGVCGLAYWFYATLVILADSDAGVHGGTAADVEPGSAEGLPADTADAAGGPATINLDGLDAAGVRAAPAEAFANMAEDDALAAARRAKDAGTPEKAQAILDRFDDVSREDEGEETDAGRGATDRFEAASTTFLEGLTDEETTEDDIGGYYHDLAFILDSLTSRAFHIVATFTLAMAATFMWLYYGGLGTVREQFLSRLPDAIEPESMRIVALHPVEAILFEVKVSVIAGAIVAVPVLGYYVWPALKDRGIARGDERWLLVWAWTLVGGVVVGSALGFGVIAPSIISYLVADAREAGMIISYRLRDFFWLIFLTTAGVGLLADIPVSMVLFQKTGLVSYRAMRSHWRSVLVAITIVSAVFTPGGVLTMVIFMVPVSLAYLLGLGILHVFTLGGRLESVEPPPETT